MKRGLTLIATQIDDEIEDTNTSSSYKNYNNPFRF